MAIIVSDSEKSRLDTRSYLSVFKIHLLSLPIVFLLWNTMGLGFSDPAAAMDLIAACESSPDEVFPAVRESVKEMSRWRSIRVVEKEHAVKAMVFNLRNYPVPVVIQVQPLNLEDSRKGSQIHIRWEQTMDPVNYPDMFQFLDAFWAQQKALGLNCVDGGTDVGL